VNHNYRRAIATHPISHGPPIENVGFGELPFSHLLKSYFHITLRFSGVHIFARPTASELLSENQQH
jgi:hypothetical protein